MNQRTRLLTLTAILIAVTLILGLLPIGYIPIIPGFAEITLMGIPVIVGTLVLGLRPGVMLGALFALTAIITAVTKSPLGAILLSESVVKTMLLLIAPRILFPVVVHLTYRYIKVKKEGLRLALAGLIGSAAHTAVFLAMLGLLFENMVAAEVFTVAAFVNGSIEAALVAAVCPPIIKAVRKVVPSIQTAGQAKEDPRVKEQSV